MSTSPSAQSTVYSADFLQKIQAILVDEEKRLKKELEKFATKNDKGVDDYEATLPNYGDEEDENAREVADYVTNKQLEVALENELRDVHKALQRLEQETYGICKYCHKTIDEKRLMARPTSSACVSCKKALTDEV